MDTVQALLKWQGYNERRLPLNLLQCACSSEQEKSYLLKSRKGGMLSKMKHFIEKTQSWPLEKWTGLGNKKRPLTFLSLCEISPQSILFFYSISYWATFWWHIHFQTSGVSSHTRERVPWVCWKCLFFHGKLTNLLVCALPSISWEFGFYKPVPVLFQSDHPLISMWL